MFPHMAFLLVPCVFGCSVVTGAGFFKFGRPKATDTTPGGTPAVRANKVTGRASNEPNTDWIRTHFPAPSPAVGLPPTYGAR